MAGIRHIARTTALQILYQQEVNPVEPELALQRYLEVANVSEKAKPFALELVKATIEHQEAIDTKLIKALEHWKLPRLSVVIRNLLRMSVCEMIVLQDTPFQVVVNEAVETARQFMDEESAKFVNGVLEKCWLNEGRTLPDRYTGENPQATTGLSDSPEEEPS